MKKLNCSTQMNSVTKKEKNSLSEMGINNDALWRVYIFQSVFVL